MSITSLESFQEKFNQALNDTINPQLLIENEVKEVEQFTSKIQRLFNPRDAFKNRKLKTQENGVFDVTLKYFNKQVFVEAFHSVLITGDFKIKPQTLQEDDLFYQTKLISVQQAKEFSKYYLWLKDLKPTTNKIQKQPSLSHKQKMLALHYYLGLDLSKYDNTKSAKILSLILDLDEGNTRKYLSYVSAGKNDVRTKNNLSKLNEVFKHQGLDDIAFTIKNDLDKIK